jgi:two-component system CheB/CheR fusion protein
MTVNKNKSSRNEFLRVGIGASAGGLESLQAFFENLDPDLTAAYIIVQHLSPDFKSLMDELLRRYTSIPISYAENKMQIAPRRVYLIPPGKNLEIFHNTFILNPIEKDKKLNLPIDIFLRSLARDAGTSAVAMILSGTGSDGTLGCRAIKEFGGMIMCQDNQSAKFDGMPESLIATGNVDYILTPQQMAGELKKYSHHPFVKKESFLESGNTNGKDYLSRIFHLLREHHNIDFSLYKESTILRQLEKRVAINQLTSLKDYIEFLEKNTHEIHTLYKEFLIGVTRFFRDPEAFDVLQERVIPELFSSDRRDEAIRIWSISCSTGEEPYSLAILIKEYMEKNDAYKNVKIFATDIDEESIAFAGTGVYPENIISDVNPEIIAKYFIQTETGFRIHKSIRNMVVFAKHNILKDPPFSRIHLITCRNVMIYLKRETQKKVLNLFYFCLKPEGYLFLGNSEAVGTLVDGFTTVDTKWKIYKYNQSSKLAESMTMPRISHKGTLRKASIPENFTIPRRRQPDDFSIGSETFHELLGPLLPPTIIVDRKHNLLYTVTDCSRFLRIPRGEMNLNIGQMIQNDTLSIAVTSLLKKADRDSRQQQYSNVSLSPSESVSLTVKKHISTQSGNEYYSISFREYRKKQHTVSESKNDANAHSVLQDYRDRITHLEQELHHKSENLQATIEELESSNEELQTSNEELIASNEELQSTNEELESVNEELYTVNTEHQEKIQELSDLNSDMNNLLRNTQIGCLFLDNDLNIRKYTEIVETITPIQKHDIGRPLDDLATDSIYPGFAQDIQEVADSLESKQKQINLFEGRWYSIKILPYRDSMDAVNGLIVSFIDTTEEYGRKMKRDILISQLEQALEMGNMAWWEWNITRNTVTASPAKSEMLGYEPDEIGEGYQGWVEHIHPDDYEKTMNAMKDHLSGKQPQYEITYRIRTKDGAYETFTDRGRVIETGADGSPVKVVGVVMKHSGKGG